MIADYRASAVIVVGAALLQLSNGLIGVLLPLRLAAAGTSDTLIGLVASAYGAGFLIAIEDFDRDPRERPPGRVDDVAAQRREEPADRCDTR